MKAPIITQRDLLELETLTARGLSNKAILEELSSPIWGSSTEEFRGQHFCSKCSQRILSLSNFCDECFQPTPSSSSPNVLAAQADADTIFDTQRYALIKNIATELARKDVRPDLIKYLLRCVNHRNCIPSLDERVVSQIASESKRRTA